MSYRKLFYINYAQNFPEDQKFGPKLVNTQTFRKNNNLLTKAEGFFNLKIF